MITLITGGSGSGKSAYAEKYICHASNEKRYKEKYYIATMQVFDDEGQRKIDRHRRLRAGKGFITIEQPRDIKKAVEKLQSENYLKTGRSALLECMSNLVANEMFQEEGAHENTVEAVLKGVRHIREQAGNLVIVTNEIFSEAADYQGETELYQEYLGQINQKIAEIADQVVEVVYGIPVYHKKNASEEVGRMCVG